MIRTLIVEDDFRVADIHAAYVSSVPGFEVVGKVHTGADAYQFVLYEQPVLILLDLYLPDEHGLELFARLQHLPRGKKMDVFVITAARDSKSLKEALQLGAANYIVKPFTQHQLSERLLAYQAAFHRLTVDREISQEEADDLSSLMRGNPSTTDGATGAKNPTIESILKYLHGSAVAVSAVELSEGIGISRATAQRYLSQMVDKKIVALELMYGTAGRPIHKYRGIRKVK